LTAFWHSSLLRLISSVLLGHQFVPDVHLADYHFDRDAVQWLRADQP
jgi:hypothetical protein